MGARLRRRTFHEPNTLQIELSTRKVQRLNQLGIPVSIWNCSSVLSA